jgi:hypothetical protein
MKKIILAIIALLPSACVHADPHLLGAHFDGEEMVSMWWVPSSRVAVTERWGGTGAVPFDMDKLVDTGRAYLKEKYSLEADLPADSISLRRVHSGARHDDVVDRWVVIVEFGGDAKGKIDRGVRILTDGTIVEPEIGRSEQDEEGNAIIALPEDR